MLTRQAAVCIHVCWDSYKCSETFWRNLIKVIQHIYVWPIKLILTSYKNHIREQTTLHIWMWQVLKHGCFISTFSPAVQEIYYTGLKHILSTATTVSRWAPNQNTVQVCEIWSHATSLWHWIKAVKIREPLAIWIINVNTLSFCFKIFVLNLS